MSESATVHVPEDRLVPRHIAVVMDGNGRWASRRKLPRVSGHKRGIEAVRNIVRGCGERGVEFLTLFAFSSENWQRPAEEVTFLMRLFVVALEEEINKLHENGIRFNVIGDLSRFEPRLVSLIRGAEHMTKGNARMQLTVAANYGGRWDIMQAVNRMVAAMPDRQHAFSESDLAPYLALSHAPEPDLIIRTGGEQRISNFLLWQLAYTELYFTDTLWPDFDEAALDLAIASFCSRERRYGRTSEQLQQQAVPEVRHRSAG